MGTDHLSTIVGKNQEEILDCQDILESLVNRAYKKAKTWATTGMAMDVVLYVGGIVAILAPRFTLDYPWMAVPISVLGFVLAYYAADIRDKAEGLKRSHEYLMGFGIAPDRGQMADLQIALANEVPKDSEGLLRQGITYWSKQPIGPKRTLENLVESSWFTKDLSRFCAWALGALFILLVSCSITLLLACNTSLAGSTVGVLAAKCIAATIPFLVSARVLRSCLAYLLLSRSSAATDQAANNLLEHNPDDAFAVQRLLSEYQIARACGPLIPTWVWRVRRNRLNEAWERIKHPQ